MRLFGLLLACGLLLAACEPVRPSTVQEDLAGKAFDPPPPTQVGLYIFRVNTISTWPVDTKVVGVVDTGIPVNRFIRVDVPAGPTEVNCITNGLPDRRLKTLAAGQTYYYEIRVDMGTYGPFCLVKEVPADYAQPLIRTYKRIEAMAP